VSLFNNFDSRFVTPAPEAWSIRRPCLLLPAQFYYKTGSPIMYFLTKKTHFLKRVFFNEEAGHSCPAENTVISMNISSTTVIGRSSVLPYKSNRFSLSCNSIKIPVPGRRVRKRPAAPVQQIREYKPIRTHKKAGPHKDPAGVISSIVYRNYCPITALPN